MSPSPEPKRRKRAARSQDAEGLSSVLDALLGEGTLRAGRAVGLLGRSWASVVGDRLAEESAPVRLDDQGSLLVRASSAAWAAQVRFLAAEVVTAANRALGEDRVASVSVVVGREGTVKRRPPGSGNW